MFIKTTLVCGIQSSFKWLYFVNILSLNTAPVSGFALVVNAEALMGFYNFKTSPKLLSHSSLSLQILCNSCSFSKELKRDPWALYRGIYSPGPAGWEGKPDGFSAENPAAVSWHSKTNTAIYQTAIPDLHKYMKNPWYFFFEKLLGG